MSTNLSIFFATIAQLKMPEFVPSLPSVLDKVRAFVNERFQVRKCSHDSHKFFRLYFKQGKQGNPGKYSTVKSPPLDAPKTKKRGGITAAPPCII
jgi:hypothetical protein